MKRLIHEVHRRSLWQVLGIYLAASWVVLQVVAQLGDSLGLPQWLEPVALLLLMIGLPVVLGTAFIQEGGVAVPSGDADEPTPAVPATDSQPAVQAATDAAAEGPGAHHRVFTWRNAVVGGVLAFALLGAGTAAFMTMRAAGVGSVGSLVAKGAIEDRSEILVSDFESSDPDLSRAATELFRVDLSQAKVVRVVSGRRVQETMGLMELPAGSPVDEPTAREIAEREGIPVIVFGEINPVGGGYVATARIESAATDSVLATVRVTATDSTEIIGAMEDLSRSLRERLGDSYGDLRKDPPLDRVTTSSLEALRLYTEGTELHHGGNEQESVRLLEQAVEVDTAFAMAWKSLALGRRNMRSGWSGVLDAEERAFRHRDRLTRLEALAVEATYYQDVEDDPDRAIAAYEGILREDPESSAATNNIGVIYWDQGDFAKAHEFYGRGKGLDSTSAISAANVAVVTATLGQTEEAERLFQEVMARWPESTWIRSWYSGFLFTQGRLAASRAQLEHLMARYPTNALLQGQSQNRLWHLDRTEGKLADADIRGRQSAEGIASAGLGAIYGQFASHRALGKLFVEHDTAAALAILDEAFDRFPPETMNPIDRPYERMGVVYALAGRPERARALLDLYLSDLDPRQRAITESYQHGALSLVLLAEGDPAAAIEERRRARPDSCETCLSIPYMLAFDAAGQADSAIVHYEAYLESHWNWRSFQDSGLRAHVLERLAALYDEAGDLENAAVYYAQFVDLWENADPELQPRVQVARVRLEEIVRERG